MSYQIVIEFPDKETADEFCSQMSDGFGEGFCNFSYWRQLPNTRGTLANDYVRETDNGRPVYFISEIFKEEE